MSASRRQEMANDLAARAIAAAERRRQEQQEIPADLAGRLASAAGADGRLTVDDALAALSDEDRKSWNPFAAPEDAPARRARELLSRPTEPELDQPEPSPKPEGSADGGEGEAGQLPPPERADDEFGTPFQPVDLDQLNRKDER